ncbi:MAG: hypothetical protein ACXVB9_05615 [Bdellovibrionota bacterium]
MDVSLSGLRVFSVFLVCLFLSACGDRYDLSTARGQQASIDDANSFLSQGKCAQADAAINPLYGSVYVTDQVRLIKASAQACFAGFQLLTFAGNLVGTSNYFKSLALSLNNTAGDSARQWMYNAVDVLTQGGNAMNGGQRSTADNSYMVFLQLGVISSILRNYGAPDSTGAKTVALTYLGTLSNVDACALTAAFSFITDSYSNSDLSDSTSQSTVASLNSICTGAGLGSCSALNRDRTQCDGANANTIKAEALVTGVNNSW